MADYPLLYANGALCVAALWVATFLRIGRLPAVLLASALLVNFVVCNLEYTDWPLRHVLLAAGFPATAPDVWMLADTAFGCACVLIGFHYRWAQSLWGLACVQVCGHLAYPLQAFDQYVYSDTLQVVLLAQLAVFFVIGGPRAWDHLRSCLDRFRRYRRSLAPRTCNTAERHGE